LLSYKRDVQAPTEISSFTELWTASSAEEEVLEPSTRKEQITIA